MYRGLFCRLPMCSWCDYRQPRTSNDVNHLQEQASTSREGTLINDSIVGTAPAMWSRITGLICSVQDSSPKVATLGLNRNLLRGAAYCRSTCLYPKANARVSVSDRLSATDNSGMFSPQELRGRIGRFPICTIKHSMQTVARARTQWWCPDNAKALATAKTNTFDERVRRVKPRIEDT